MSVDSSERGVLTLEAVSTRQRSSSSSSSSPVVERLNAVLPGLSTDELLDTAELYAKSAEAIRNGSSSSTTSPCTLWWVPGRVEVAGKHTDYCGGRSLVAAVCKGLAVVSTCRQDDICLVYSVGAGKGETKEAKLRLAADVGLGDEVEAWVNYPATVIRRLVMNFGIAKGCTVAICSNLPGAAGMSTSSAVVCAMYIVLAQANRLESRPEWQQRLAKPERLYEYLGTIENGQDFDELLKGEKGVGTFGGSEDHTAIMSSCSGKVKMFSYCPTRLESDVNFPKEWTIAIGVSAVVAEKTGAAQAAYNNVSLLAKEGVASFSRSRTKSFTNWAEVLAHERQQGSNDPAAAIRNALAQQKQTQTEGYMRRFDQFFTESEELVPKLCRAVETKDESSLREAAAKSNELSDTHLNNLVPQTRELVRLAIANGAIAASVFGAGFGGSVWAIVAKSEVATFIDRWEASYKEAFPDIQGSTFFTTDPSSGATEL